MITEWNETVATITGRKKAEVTGWHFASNFIPEGHRASMQARPPAVPPTIVPVYRRRRHPHGLPLSAVCAAQYAVVCRRCSKKRSRAMSPRTTSSQCRSVSSRNAALTSHAPGNMHRRMAPRRTPRPAGSCGEPSTDIVCGLCVCVGGPGRCWGRGTGTGAWAGGRFESGHHTR